MSREARNHRRPRIPRSFPLEGPQVRMDGINECHKGRPRVSTFRRVRVEQVTPPGILSQT